VCFAACMLLLCTVCRATRDAAALAVVGALDWIIDSVPSRQVAQASHLTTYIYIQYMYVYVCVVFILPIQMCASHQCSSSFATHEAVSSHFDASNSSQLQVLCERLLTCQPAKRACNTPTGRGTVHSRAVHTALCSSCSAAA
jgi:hypothetical protein